MAEMRQAQSCSADEAGVRPRVSWSTPHGLLSVCILTLLGSEALSKTALLLSLTKIRKNGEEVTPQETKRRTTKSKVKCSRPPEGFLCSLITGTARLLTLENLGDCLEF